MTKTIYIPMIIGGIIGYKYAMKKREIDDLKRELEAYKKPHRIVKPKTLIYPGDRDIFDTRQEAELILSRLEWILREYLFVSVADFYDLIGIESAFLDSKYGWKDLSLAKVGSCVGGYFINFPPTKKL